MNVGALDGGWQLNGMYSQRMGLTPEERAAKFAEMDIDQDGGLDIIESGMSEERFAQMDFDGDGRLTEEDMLAMLQQMGRPDRGLGGPNISEMMAQLDSDGDEQLSQEEFGGDTSVFDSLDTNEDGFVSLEELEAGKPKHADGKMRGPGPGFGWPGELPSAAELMEEFDSDSDGQLSNEEFGGNDGLFDSLDTNKDGMVSLEELQAGETRREEERQARNENGSSMPAYVLNAYLAQGNINLEAMNLSGYLMSNTGNLDTTA